MQHIADEPERLFPVLAVVLTVVRSDHGELPIKALGGLEGDLVLRLFMAFLNSFHSSVGMGQSTTWFYLYIRIVVLSIAKRIRYPAR